MMETTFSCCTYDMPLKSGKRRKQPSKLRMKRYRSKFIIPEINNLTTDLANYFRITTELHNDGIHPSITIGNK